MPPATWLPKPSPARRPDGYTLLSDGIAQAISMSLFKSVTFDIVGDFEPIGFIGSTPAILVVNAELGVKSVAELITLAKSRPGELTYGTSGVGTAPHMAGELFNLMAGVKLRTCPIAAPTRPSSICSAAGCH